MPRHPGGSGRSRCLVLSRIGDTARVRDATWVGNAARVRDAAWTRTRFGAHRQQTEESREQQDTQDSCRSGRPAPVRHGLTLTGYLRRFKVRCYRTLRLEHAPSACRASIRVSLMALTPGRYGVTLEAMKPRSLSGRARTGLRVRPGRLDCGTRMLREKTIISGWPKRPDCQAISKPLARRGKAAMPSGNTIKSAA